MNKRELKQKSKEELEKQLSELKAKLASIQPKILAGQERNTRAAKMIRRDIAQILGIISQQPKSEVKQEEQK